MNFHKSVFNDIIKIAALMLFAFFPMPHLVIAGESLSRTPRTHFIDCNKSENTISVNLVNSDISDVAESLSEQAEIKILLDESISRSISSKFQDMPLESGIKRLLGPVSSAFIFIKEKSVSGEDIFRLKTVKIFESGNMLGAKFKAFNKGVSAGGRGNGVKTSPFVSASVSDTESKKQNTKSDVSPQNQKPGYQRRHPSAYGAARHEIMLTRRNLDMIRSKNQAETDAANQKIMELKAESIKNFSPDQRPTLMRELNQAEQELIKIKRLNSRIIIDEERNLRGLIREGASLESQRKFADRQTELKKQEKIRERQREIRKQRSQSGQINN